jgi:hypothetical protein
MTHDRPLTNTEMRELHLIHGVPIGEIDRMAPAKGRALLRTLPGNGGRVPPPVIRTQMDAEGRVHIHVDGILLGAICVIDGDWFQAIDPDGVLQTFIHGIDAIAALLSGCM